jgi:salicylate hydroxylase
LEKWGVYETMKGPVEPKTCTVYNYKGKVLAHEDNFDKNIRRKYNAPFSDSHRVDLQQALAKRASELGVDLVLSTRVVELDFGTHEGDTATVTTSTGTKYTADLVIGADGLWSACRSIALGRKDAPLPTGDLAFRIVLNIEQIKDPKLKDMVQNPGVRFWIGPDAHVVAYSMRGGTVYNIVLLVPDDLPESVARMEGSIDEMRSLFEGWDPV